MSGRVNVHVSSCINFAESFTILTSTSHKVSKEHNCGAALQGAAASVHLQYLRNELKCQNWPQAITFKGKKEFVQSSD